MTQYVAYTQESSERQPHPTIGQCLFTLAPDQRPEHLTARRRRGLSGEQIANFILVLTTSSWIGWLLLSFAHALETYQVF